MIKTDINLALGEVPTTDCRFLRIVDNSSYSPSIQVENAILEITPPGYSCAVFYGLDKNFNNVYNSSSLKINTAKNPKDIITIPDGVYKLKYSIKPNTQTAVEYEIMRNCQLRNKLAKAIGELFKDRCNLLKRSFDSQREELEWIKQLMEASKYMVDDLGDTRAGISLYDESNRLLNSYNERGC